MDAVLVQETSPSGRARQRFEAASQHEEGEDGAREAWEAELMQALKDEREVSHAPHSQPSFFRTVAEAAGSETASIGIR